MTLLEKMTLGILILAVCGILQMAYICFQLRRVYRALDRMSDRLKSVLVRLALMEPQEDVEQLRKELESKS